jgi:hypothetical protein
MTRLIAVAAVTLAVAAFGPTTPVAAQDAAVMEPPKMPPPPSARGHRVDLSDKKLSDAAFGKRLAAGAVGPKTNALDLSGNRLTHTSIQALGKLDLATLTSLTLDGNKIGDEGLRLLGTLPAFAQLRTLHLAHTGVTADGLATFLRTPPPALTNLGLNGNAVGDAGAASLAAHPTGWTTLGLRDVGLTAAGAKALLAGDALDGCSYLDVAGNGLDTATTDALWKPVSLASGEVVTE